ncbi:MAG TPA: hypothetical protein VGN14_17490 [Candidatus Elarobacter sp.]
MNRRLASLPLLAVLAALPAAANADDLATVRTRVAAAMQAAKSFVVTTTSGSGTFAIAMTFVAPDRYHSVLVFGGERRDVILIGQLAYVSADGKSYRKVDAPPDVVAAEGNLRSIAVDNVLPDATANGKTWGRFVTTAAGPQKDQRLTCTYDKTTYRLAECSNAGLTLAFSRYDDPANAVSAPLISR